MMIHIKKEIHFVSFNGVSFSITALESHTSDKSHFYTQTPQLSQETQNASL